MIGTNDETRKRVFYIYYPVQFKKNKAQVQALINLESEINTIHPTFAKQLGLLIRSTNLGVQKIDRTTLEIYGMVVAAFLVKHRANQVRFFK